MQDDRPDFAVNATTGQVARDVIALAEETLRVDRIEKVTGHVRVIVKTDTTQESVSSDLLRTEARVERIEIDRTLEHGEPSPVQTMRGETTVIPVLEEIIVVEKRLVLRAEIHITPVTSTETVATAVELRRQTATIDRLAAGDVSDTGNIGRNPETSIIED